jgi:serine/threonine protein kinase
LSHIGPSLEYKQRARLVAEIAEAIHRAHTLGIQHRDLKPGNILIDAQLSPKILDFGLAGRDPGRGHGVGTPAYMAPEQLDPAQPIDARTDIYALGVILYEMLTGTPPFTGSNHFQLLYAHGNQMPDPPSQRSKRVNIPSHVESAILKALEKNPDERFQSMREFLSALARPTVPKRARTFKVPVLVATFAAVVAFFLWPTSPEPPDPPSPVATIEPPATATKKSDEPTQTAESAPIPETVMVRLESRPKGATVAIHGERRGRTPLEVELTRGEPAKVRFSLRGYRTERREIGAQSDETLRVRLRKKPEPAPPSIKTDF